jgi:peptide/nickel transport system substrate-binding protein
MRRAACALAALIALAGCGVGGSSGSGSQIVLARVKDAVVLDPSHATDGLSLLVTNEVLETLVSFKPGGFDIGPGLATSWHASPDGLTWTFTLRPNATFSDGTPADAAAVKFNVDRWRLRHDPNHGNFSYSYWVAMFGGYSDDPTNPGVVKDVRVNGSDRVTFVLNRSLAPFLHDLAMPPFGIGSPAAIKANAQAFEQKPVGSGPYTVAEWVRDDHITLTANPSYSGSLPKPAIATAIIRDIPDQATSVLSIEKGDIDMLTDPRSDDARTLRAQPSLDVVAQPPNNVAYLALNVEKKPFGDVLVRRAVAEAIDLPAIVKALYAPGSVVADNFIPRGMLCDDPSVHAWPHDVAAAKALLARAGFSHGFSTTMLFPTSPRPYMPEPQRLAEAIQADLKDGGINVVLQPLELAVFLSKIHNGDHEMCLIGWTGDNGDPDNFYYTLLDQDSAHKGDAQNYSFWRDPAFHRLMLAGQHTLDDPSRAKIYQQAAVLVHDQVPLVPIVHTAVPIVMRKTFAGFVPSPTLDYHFELMHAVK